MDKQNSFNVDWRLMRGCAFEKIGSIPSNSVHLTVTSPPYYRQKDYGVVGQMGWERRLIDYLDRLKELFDMLLRVTSDSGSCFVVIGDSYARRSLQLVPQRAAVAASEVGWTIRNDLIWAKKDAAPGGASDRWRSTYEHVLFLTKRARGYKFRDAAIRVEYSEQTRRRWGNGQRYGGPKAGDADAARHRFRRGTSFRLNPAGVIPSDVLVAPTARSHLNHYATFPFDLVEQLVLATTDPSDVVLDPFAGTATTGVVALRHRRSFIGIELSAPYAKIAVARLGDVANDRPS